MTVLQREKVLKTLSNKNVGLFSRFDSIDVLD